MPSGAAARSDAATGAARWSNAASSPSSSRRYATFAADPALPITRCPRSFANWAARLPTAPAAADTQTTSPPRSSAAARSPAYAVRPIPPSGPRYHCGRRERRVQARERAEAAERGLVRADDGVVAPAGRVPDGVAGREPVRARGDDHAHGHDPVHRGPERKGREVAVGRPSRAGAREGRDRPMSTCCARGPRPVRARAPARRRRRSGLGAARRADAPRAGPRGP